MKKHICIFLSIVLILCVSGCSNTESAAPYSNSNVETTVFTDSCGREVTIPKHITRVAPSGSTAQMIMYAIADDLLVGLSSTPSTDQMKYFPENMISLPTFGQFYGSKANMNLESLIAAEPDIIIDIGV